LKLSDVLNQPKLYSLVQAALKTKRYEDNLSQLIGVVSQIRVLDFGCGPGDLYPRFKDCYYLGLDPLQSCIDRAQTIYGQNDTTRTFALGNQLSLKQFESGSFDLVIAIGVLHHISDEESMELVEEVRRILKPNSGRFITLDPVRHNDESILSRILVSQDRGRFVRTPNHYKSLISKRLSIQQSKVLKSLIRIPYDQFATISS